MPRVSLISLTLIGVALTLSPESRPPALGADAPSSFAVFVDDYFNASFDARPSRGTGAGLHQYDDRLEDGSAEAMKKRIETLKTFQTRLDKLRAAKLTEDDAIDAEVLDGRLKSELLDLETLRTWRNNPMR
jgi:uncharacterized protein (DUF885 family)